MKIYQYTLFENSSNTKINIPFTPDMVFMFISPSFEGKKEFIDNLHSFYPEALIAGCSTYDDSGVDNPYRKQIEFTAVKLDKGQARIASVSTDEVYTSYEAGDLLSEKLNAKDIKHVFLFSSGYNVRAADLLNGFRYSMLDNISITGNISNPVKNKSSFVVENGKILNDHIIALALYGQFGENDPASINRFEKVGPDVLSKETIQEILLDLEAKPEPQYS